MDVIPGSFMRLGARNYTRFSMNVRGFAWFPIKITVDPVRDPPDAPSPESLNATLWIPFAA